MQYILWRRQMNRSASVSRKTKETNIDLKLVIDGAGKGTVKTGVGFLDHMLDLFKKHGLFDLSISATGDLHVDGHHTVEDIGIVLGQAINSAIGEKKSIIRYGNATIPMDEALAMVALDLGGRPYLVYDVDFKNERVGEMDTELFKEFFQAIATNANMNLHIRMLSEGNNHHMIEAVFKAFAKAMDMATSQDNRISDVMSTKGII
jgi:imidazoleglycerol-phosphate dehydratase